MKSAALRLRAATPALLAAATAAWLISCAGTQVPQPTAKSLEFAERNGQNTSLASLKHGRTLYVGRCQACHTLHQPKEFTVVEWPKLTQDMATNAQLNPDQLRDITAYLVALSAEQRDTTSVGTPDKPVPTGAPQP